MQKRLESYLVEEFPFWSSVLAPATRQIKPIRNAAPRRTRASIAQVCGRVGVPAAY